MLQALLIVLRVLILLSQLAGVVPWSIDPKRRGKFYAKKSALSGKIFFKTSKYHKTDPSRFKRKSVNCPGPYNCVCTTLSDFLAGSIKAGLAVQEWMQKIRNGRFSYLYDEYEKRAPASDFDNIYFITRTDTSVIARELGVRIYEYFEQSAEWIVYCGCHKGPEHGSIHSNFRYLESRGEHHCMMVCGPKKL